jgi:hypothetical protein
MVNEVKINVIVDLTKDVVFADVSVQIKLCVKKFFLNLCLTAHHRQ